MIFGDAPMCDQTYGKLTKNKLEGILKNVVGIASGIQNVFILVDKKSLEDLSTLYDIKKEEEGQQYIETPSGILKVDIEDELISNCIFFQKVINRDGDNIETTSIHIFEYNMEEDSATTDLH